jgi:hypothetical protein
MCNIKHETMTDFEGQFVYCITLGVVYKSMRLSEKRPSKKKVKENKIKGNLFAIL